MKAADMAVIDGVVHLGPDDAGYSTTVRGHFEAVEGWPKVVFRIAEVVSVEPDGAAR